MSNLQDLFDNVHTNAFKTQGLEARAKSSDKQKRVMSDPRARARVAEVVKAKWQDPAYRHHGSQAQREAMARLTPEQQVARGAKISNSKLKPIHTPYGCFDSKTQAAEAMLAQGIGNAHGKLGVWLKTDPTNYYYL